MSGFDRNQCPFSAGLDIPATDAGVEAITQLTAEGRSINVTLIFGLDRYAQVVEAYLSGLEACASDGVRAAQAGGDLSGIRSVASFFLSRVDTAIDGRLQEIGTPPALRLRGRAALAQAELAYEHFRHSFSGPRWQRLAARGAHVQKPLWASTSTKNPEYPDLLYVTDLIGPDTVNTMTESTIAAFLDHGTVAPTLGTRAHQARDTVAALESLGIDLAAVSQSLEDQGVSVFVAAFDEVLHAIAQKAGEIADAA